MLLSIHTCGTPGSVALGRIDAASGDAEVVAQAELAARTYSAQLIPRIAEMMAAHGATVRDLEAIVVVSGPGSFTGIRVGLSAAKGLAEASGAKLVALSRLALLAACSGRDPVLAAIDAGRGEYYVGDYRQGRPVREVLLTAAELRAAAAEPGAGTLVCESPGTNGGNGGEFKAGNATLLPAPGAADALRLGAARFLAGAFDEIEWLDANYLRRSDAEVATEQRRASAANPC